MTLHDFNYASYGELICIMQGYNRRLHDRSRESWEQARHIAYYAVVPHVKPGSVSSPQTLIPMSWDIKKSQFKTKEEEAAAKEMVIEKLKFRIDDKRRKEIANQRKNVRKHGKPR